MSEARERFYQQHEAQGEFPQSAITSAREGTPRLAVTFQSLRWSDRVFEAIFDLGSDEANGKGALDHAWRFNASIVRSEVK